MKVAKKKATKVVHHTRDYWHIGDRGPEKIKLSEGFCFLYQGFRTENTDPVRFSKVEMDLE